MVSKEILDIVLEESETMIIEWADTQSGFGFDKIDYELVTYFKEEQIPEKIYIKIVENVRQFIKEDMKIMG
ncbi:MAG: hypothetical protein J7L15_01045 [Clostridiales bacterium]|nr:hypothetical protein [Clostridiales bacterium]